MPNMRLKQFTPRRKSLLLQSYPLLCPFPGKQTSICLFPFPSYSVMCGSFLQPCLPSSLSASLQLVFSENDSTCRHIFDVFVRVGEFSVLFLNHLLTNIVFWYIKNNIRVCIYWRTENKAIDKGLISQINEQLIQLNIRKIKQSNQKSGQKI